MFKRRAGTISFATTLTLLLAAFAINAGPNDAKDEKLANLQKINEEFAPEVADPTKRSQWIEVGKEVKARLTPIKVDGSYAVDVVLKRAQSAAPAATVKLDLKCAGETMSPMSRVPMPVQVDLGSKELQASIKPGETVKRRVVFEQKVDPNAIVLGGLPEMAKVTLVSGKLVVKDAVFVALNGQPTKEGAQMMGNLGGLGTGSLVGSLGNLNGVKPNVQPELEQVQQVQQVMQK